MTKQAKIHPKKKTPNNKNKNQSTKLDRYTGKKKITQPRNHPSPHGFKIRGAENTEIAPQEEEKHR